MLMDAGTSVWANNQLDQALRRALEDYSRAALDPRSRAQPNQAISTFTPTANKREQDVSALTGILAVNEVWLPFTAAAPEDPPRCAEFRFYWNGSTPLLYLDGAVVPDGSMAARVFYIKPHALNGLDGASASTFPAGDDNLLLTGAAGYSCEMRSVDLNETSVNMAVSTPNYAALANLFLDEFRASLTPRSLVQSAPLSGYSRTPRVWDPNTLGWR